MNDDRKSILGMLAAGKITAKEAERLLTALDPKPTSPAADTSGTYASPSASAPARTKSPKYLRVLVEADESTTGLRGGPTTVNVHVPMQLLRAGIRLAGLIPPQAHDQLDQAFSKHGVPVTLSQIKPENLEELIDHLGDFTVDVGQQGRQQIPRRLRIARVQPGAAPRVFNSHWTPCSQRANNDTEPFPRPSEAATKIGIRMAA